MQIVVFEDEHVSELFPITVGRPAYAISCGSLRLIDWLAHLRDEVGGTLRGAVRPHLQMLQQLDFPEIEPGPPAPHTPLLVVNARLVPSHTHYQTLRRLVAAGRTSAVVCDRTLAAAYVAEEGPAPPPDAVAEHWAHYAHHTLLDTLLRADSQLAVFQWPHEVVQQHLAILNENLAWRLAHGTFREIADGVFAAADAELGAYCVTDTRQGPVLLDRQASVGPHCFLRGPAYLGPKARVIEHAAIKDAVALGHTTKIGGEIEASIVEPYTNKQHHGFLGHSYLGSWINLGAGTSNSDLKNTYGPVKMEYRGQQVPTGMQFVGCIMGDYAKSAINTGIFTGKTIGCCSMLYGFVTTNVPSFVNYARLFGQVTELPPEVMIATQQRMFARRQVPQRPCDIALIQAMYELTRHERQLAGEPLSL
jgi:glucose-1-phosphate thymidylyltransferase